MFARSVSIRLKPNGLAEFSRVIEKETIPLLRKQEGFEDEITFFVPGGREAVAISLWDRKEDADAYGRKAYPAVLKALGNVVEGDPEVRIYEVSNSTFHKIAPPIFARV
jgi:heme-degrading monooxygenase HmoA